MREAALVGLLAFTVGATAAAEDLEYPRNQTDVRESHGDIPSIVNDVRSPFMDVMPGTGLRGYGDVQLGYHFEHLYYRHAREDERDQGREHLVDARLRLRCYWDWLTFELHPGAYVSHYANDYALKNLEGALGFSLYQGRYHGGALVLGCAVPVGEGKQLGDSNDVTQFNPAYLAELRFTEHADLNVFHLNIAGRYDPKGQNNLDKPLNLDNGDVFPANEDIEVTTLHLEGRFAWSYRTCRWSRIGLEAIDRYDHFHTRNDVILRNNRFFAAAILELNPAPWCAIQGLGGVEPSRYHADRHGSLIAGASTVMRF